MLRNCVVRAPALAPHLIPNSYPPPLPLPPPPPHTCCRCHTVPLNQGGCRFLRYSVSFNAPTAPPPLTAGAFAGIVVAVLLCCGIGVCAFLVTKGIISLGRKSSPPPQQQPAYVVVNAPPQPLGAPQYAPQALGAPAQAWGGTKP